MDINNFLVMKEYTKDFDLYIKKLNQYLYDNKIKSSTRTFVWDVMDYYYWIYDWNWKCWYFYDLWEAINQITLTPKQWIKLLEWKNLTYNL